MKCFDCLKCPLTRRVMIMTSVDGASWAVAETGCRSTARACMCTVLSGGMLQATDVIVEIARFALLTLYVPLVKWVGSQRCPPAWPGRLPAHACIVNNAHAFIFSSFSNYEFRCHRNMVSLGLCVLTYWRLLTTEFIPFCLYEA